MKIFSRIEIEWRIVLLAAVLLLAFAFPVQRLFRNRLQSTLAQGIDPNLESLLRSQLGKDSTADSGGAVAQSIQRHRQWQALIPIIIDEQQTVLIGFSSLLLISLLFLALWSGKRLTRPLKDLAFAAEQIGRGSKTVIRPNSGGALGRLEQSMSTMQDELERLRERARAQGIESAWRDIARVMAHEIKNPLTPMQLTLDRIQEKAEEGTQLSADELTRFVERMNLQVATLERLVNDFRSFAREPEAQLMNIELEKAVYTIGENLKGSIETDCTGAAIVRADPHLLDRVLLNIWKNSLEAGATRMLVDIESDGGRAVMRIRDDGPGIAPEHVEQVWIPYVTFKKGGTGLGLPVVKRLLESMNAGIHLESSTNSDNHGVLITIDFETTDTGARKEHKHG